MDAPPILFFAAGTSATHSCPRGLSSPALLFWGVVAQCYYLKGVGVALEQALVAHAEAFLVSHEYTLLSPPLFMKSEIMAEVAQLSQFAEELYKVRRLSLDSHPSFVKGGEGGGGSP